MALYSQFYLTPSSRQVDRLKSGLQSIARDVDNGTQNDVTALVKTVASELDCYVNARFTKVQFSEPD